jgi:regulator of sigma E protease
VDGQKFDTSGEYITQYYQATAPVTFEVQREGEESPIQIQVPPAEGSAAISPEYALILGVVEDAPAEKAGIQPGDIVVAFNEEPLVGVDDLKNRTVENAGKEISLTLERGTETFDVRLTPRANPPQGQGAMGIIINKVWEDPASGLTYTDGFVQQDIVPQPIGEAVNYSLNKSYAIIATTVSLPSKLMRGETRPEEARPVSVLGMSQIGGTIIQESIQQRRIGPILDFIATISVALGFFNLLPIPALDGGRIVFVLVEIVRGRPIAPEREGLVHLIGLALLLSLSVLVILNDVIHPIIDTIR